MGSARKPPPTQKDFKHIWHVQAWMEANKKRQVDLINELGWSKAKASDVMGGQQYTQSLIDDLAPWLNAKPYEMLMTPAEAMALRQINKAAVQIVHESRTIENTQPEQGQEPEHVQQNERDQRRAS